MKRSKLNQISKKKLEQIKKEKPIRLQLRIRSGNRCEYCGRAEDIFGLHPHEIHPRSLGGCLSMENSIMLCQGCHSRAQKHEIESSILIDIVNKANQRYGRIP